MNLIYGVDSAYPASIRLNKMSWFLDFVTD